MHTPEDLEEIVINYLTPGLTGFIAGQLTRKDERLTGSDEDVTVGTLSLGDSNVQRGIVLVTMYLKDIQVRNESEQKMDEKPNKPRFDAITRKVYELLGENIGKFWATGNLWITNPSPLYAEVAQKEHFRTIRVQVKIHDENT